MRFESEEQKSNPSIAKNEAAGLPWVSAPPLTTGVSRATAPRDDGSPVRDRLHTDRSEPPRSWGAPPLCARGLRAPPPGRSTAARSRTGERARRRVGRRRRQPPPPAASSGKQSLGAERMGRKGKEGSGLLAWQWPAVGARDAPAREPPLGGYTEKRGKE